MPRRQGGRNGPPDLHRPARGRRPSATTREGDLLKVLAWKRYRSAVERYRQQGRSADAAALQQALQRYFDTPPRGYLGDPERGVVFKTELRVGRRRYRIETTDGRRFAELIEVWERVHAQGERYRRVVEIGLRYHYGDLMDPQLDETYRTLARAYKVSTRTVDTLLRRFRTLSRKN